MAETSAARTVRERSKTRDDSTRTVSGQVARALDSYVLDLQRAVGNQAVLGLMGRRAGATHVPRAADARVIQRAPLPAMELEKLSVDAFDKHHKAEQMDWANAAFDDVSRSTIWEIIEWGTSGLGPITLKSIIDDVKADARTLEYIKAYCQALAGKLGATPTTTLATLDSLAKIKKAGKWITELTALLGGPLMKATMPLDKFNLLVEIEIDSEDVARKFVKYYTNQKPVLQTPTGKEIWGFVKLVKDEGANIDDYVMHLKTIRNFHKFEKVSLDKLKLDLGKKDRPLTLVFVSPFDHNGAFTRHEHVNKVIQNEHLRAFAIEGASIDVAKGLSASGLSKIAADHGMAGKITQVMFAGHGYSTSMEAVGKETSVEQKGEEYKVESKNGIDLWFGRKDYNTFWSDFFEALFKNMEMRGGLKPKVLLRACLTASNSVDTKQLKQIMKDKNIIDVDNASVDPTTDENQAKIRAAIVEYIKTYGSLASVLTEKAKGRADVLGAQASITAASTGSINKDTGELEIVALTDPQVAGPKINYVREGKEPTGALKAVIESWAHDPATCFDKMTERVKEAVASDDDFIIQVLYNMILTQFKKDILAANALVRTAGAWHDIARGGAECRVAALHGDKTSQDNAAVLYPLLLGRFANKFAKLVIYEDWQLLDHSKRSDFINLLADATFDRTNVANYIDWELLGPHIPSLLGLSGDSLRGRILLGLVGLTEPTDPRPDCINFLKTQVDMDGGLSGALSGELKAYSENQLRKKMGIPAASVAATTGKAPTKNIKVAANLYVEPMMTTTRTMTKSGLFDWAQVKVEPRAEAETLESQYRTKDYTLVGHVKTLAGMDAGWYMIRLDTGKVAYIESRFF